jgi:ABC-2 type transport system permease protein
MIQAPRTFRTINWRGLWTLYLKEVRRFVKVITQTVLAPMVTTLLFYAVFALALGPAVDRAGDVPYLEFLAPGLIIMAMAQNSFANTSSSIIIGKVQGNIVDVLMPPLEAIELIVGFALGGVTRGLVVGLAVAAGMAIFAPIHIAHPGYILFHGVMGSLMLALLGIIGAIWSEKFDHIAAVTNFVITPFAFLSGTFYSIERLPPAWSAVAHLNPFFYMIDGFRYGFFGVSDVPPLHSLAVVVVAFVVLAALALRLLRKGYKLRH